MQFLIHISPYSVRISVMTIQNKGAMLLAGLTSDSSDASLSNKSEEIIKSQEVVEL